MISIALSFLGRFWPYLVAGAVGFSAAWSTQGGRLERAKTETIVVEQAFSSYKQEQMRLAYESAETARKQREETERDWRKKYADLQKDQDVFKRCVAAGKCGPDWVRYMPGAAAIAKPGVPTAQRLDAARRSPILVAGDPATQEPEVIRDCANVQLRLNELQFDIEKQDGY